MPTAKRRAPKRKPQAPDAPSFSSLDVKPSAKEEVERINNALVEIIHTPQRLRYKPQSRALLVASPAMLNLIMQLARAGNTQVEIASLLGVSKSTLQRFLDSNEDAAAAAERGADMLKASLRSKQVELALAGDTTMLIWLGKQLLGQKDHRHVTADGTINHAHTVSETRAWAEQIAGFGDNHALPKPVQN